MPTVSGSLQANITGTASDLGSLLAFIRPTISGSSDIFAFVRPTMSGNGDVNSYINGFYPPYILDFSLDREEYTTATGTVWVDIVDYYRPIDTSRTYFSIDGTVVSGTFTPISVPGVMASGVAYRMSYNSPDNFGSIDDPARFLVHVENDFGAYGGIAEEDYYLTLGYQIDFYNQAYKYIDFGYDSQVVVRALIENNASCTKESGYAYWFETVPTPQSNLSCSIVGLNNNEGLPASISPQAPTAHFYGRRMEIVIRARDFSGNEMDPFTLVYTIEEES